MVKLIISRPSTLRRIEHIQLESGPQRHGRRFGDEAWALAKVLFVLRTSRRQITYAMRQQDEIGRCFGRITGRYYNGESSLPHLSRMSAMSASGFSRCSLLPPFICDAVPATALINYDVSQESSGFHTVRVSQSACQRYQWT